MQTPTLVPRTIVPIAILFGAGLLVPGCAGPSGESPGAPAPSEPSEATAEQPTSEMDPETLERMEALYWSRVESDRSRFTSADVAFMSGMIGHHAQALAMVAMAPDRTEKPSILTLAARIESSQRDEITRMESWLRARDQPVPHWELDETRLTLHMPDTIVDDTPGLAHAHDDGPMPGMLTPAQMKQLRDASGQTFDRLFLDYMIDHHRGAVVMVRELFATDGAAQDPEVFRFASDVQVDQSTEIARMERMLQAMRADAGNP